MAIQPYEMNGVIVNPTEMKNGDTIKVTYDGLLAKSGADAVYAFVGYGQTHDWEETSVFQMMRTGDIKFEVGIPVVRKGNVSIAFKDSASNWDNNNGYNYVFKDHTRK